jgi:glycosyltransferase involved in cell wall biosynthesis
LHVLFVTQYGPRAASSRTRVFNYLPFLRSHGVECDVLTILTDDLLAGSQVIASNRPFRKMLYYLRAAWRSLFCGARMLRRAGQADVLFIQKVIFPAPLRWCLRRLSTPVVYDFDDAIFTTEIRSGHWLARWKEARNTRGLPAMLALSQHAVVENDYTGEMAQRFCPVLTITGPIDTERYRSDQLREGPGADGEGVLLGWIGSGSTVAYLDRIRVPLQRLTVRFAGLRLLVIGAEWSAPGVNVECRDWDLEREAADLVACDIGIMPVPDDPWTRGKGGYKLLQYMAASLPVVTDPVGINVEIVASGESGLLVEGEDGWEAGLARLIEDGDLRQRLGAAGRDRVEAMYSQGVQQDQLLTMLRQVAGVPA